MGRADGKAPFCLAEHVTVRVRDGLTEACVDGKPVLIFGCYEVDRETFGLEQPVEIRSVFVRDYI